MPGHQWLPPRLSLGASFYFKIFVNDLDEGIECILSKFGDDAKLGGTFDLLEVRKALQRDLHKLDWGAKSNYVAFNRAKYHVLHLSLNKPIERYRL